MIKTKQLKVQLEKNKKVKRIKKSMIKFLV